MKVIHGIFYLKSGVKIEEAIPFEDTQKEEIAEITSNINILLERFKKAKRDQMFGIIRFNYTTVDVNELAALKFYEEEVADK
mgnify:CR=1 FL=1